MGSEFNRYFEVKFCVPTHTLHLNKIDTFRLTPLLEYLKLLEHRVHINNVNNVVNNVLRTSYSIVVFYYFLQNENAVFFFFFKLFSFVLNKNKTYD